MHRLVGYLIYFNTQICATYFSLRAFHMRPPENPPHPTERSLKHFHPLHLHFAQLIA